MSKAIQKVEEINFLASTNYQSFTYTAKRSYKKGDIFPSNDGEALGIVLHDVTVEGSEHQPVGVMVEGYVLYDRFKTKPKTAAVTALKGIKFLDADRKIKTEGEA